MINFTVIFRIVGIFLFVIIIGMAVKAIKEYAPDVLTNCNYEYQHERTVSSSRPFNETQLYLYFPEETKLNVTEGTSAEALCNGFEITTDQNVYFLCEDGKIFKKVKVCKGHSLKTLSNTSKTAQDNIKVLDEFQRTQYLNSSSP